MKRVIKKYIFYLFQMKKLIQIYLLLNILQNGIITIFDFLRGPLFLKRIICLAKWSRFLSGRFSSHIFPYISLEKSLTRFYNIFPV